MYLLDTMVISEFQKKRPDARITAWLNSKSLDFCYLSVITIGEIYKEICRDEKRNPPFAQRLTLWVEELKTVFDSRLLSIDEDVVEMWGVISCQTGNSSMDNMIAATAKVYDLIVVTRNIRHFQETGAPCVNPWETL